MSNPKVWEETWTAHPWKQSRNWTIKVAPDQALTVIGEAFAIKSATEESHSKMEARVRLMAAAPEFARMLKSLCEIGARIGDGEKIAEMLKSAGVEVETDE